MSEPTSPAAPTRGHRLMIRRLMRATRKAVLSTAMAEGGAPYGSLVTVATDQAGHPLLLLSGLSDHTKNLLADPRAALLFDGTAGFDNPQEGPRATVMGTARRIDDPAARRRFLAAHPAAAMYAGFGDFGFWRLEIERVHWVGGFARALWIDDGVPVDAATAQRLDEVEPSVLDHMNQDHAEAVALYATRLLGQPAGDWRLAAVDVDGCDLATQTRSLRMPFDDSVDGPEGVRHALKGLAERARANT